MMDEGFRTALKLYDSLGDMFEEIEFLHKEVKHLKDVNEILRKTIKIHNP